MALGLFFKRIFFIYNIILELFSLFVYDVGVINMKIQPVSSKRLFQNGCMNETYRAPYNSMFLSQNMNEKIIDGNI